MEFTLGAYETWRDGRFGDRFAENSLSRPTVVQAGRDRHRVPANQTVASFNLDAVDAQIEAPQTASCLAVRCADGTTDGRRAEGVVCDFSGFGAPGRQWLTLPLVLYPFRYRDPLTGKWVRARYKAEIDVIAERFAEWEITGPAELRVANSVGFNPYRQPVTHAELMLLEEPAPEINPHLEQPPAIDRIECFAVFLRRYITYCARHRRFAQMESAARLHREIGAIDGYGQST